MLSDYYRIKVLDWIHSTPAWKRWLLWTVLGKEYCPYCDSVQSWRFVAVNPIHPDGPPLFTEWVCKGCNNGTGLEPSFFLVEAAENVE